MMEDILGMMEDYSIDKAVFLGHSMGGKLAMNLAAHYSEKVEKLIVADMSLREGEFKEIHAAIMDTIAKTDMEKFSSYGDLEKYFDGFIDKKKVVLFALKNVKKNADGTFAWKLNYFSLYQMYIKLWKRLCPWSLLQSRLFLFVGNTAITLWMRILKNSHLVSTGTNGKLFPWPHTGFMQIIPSFCGIGDGVLDRILRLIFLE